MEDDNMKFYEKNVANKNYNRNLSDLNFCPHILMPFGNEIICKTFQYCTVIFKKYDFFEYFMQLAILICNIVRAYLNR